MTFKNAFKTAIGMSLISMIAMEIAMNSIDYFKKNCINIITKNKSIGLIGGISLNDKKEAEKYR